MGKLISLGEWAGKNGITPDTARQRAIRGAFTTAIKIGRNWCIDEDEKLVDHRKKEENAMKYIVIDETKTDMFTHEFATAEEAIKFADSDFATLTAHDKKYRTGYYIIESVNPDPEADNHFDGEEIKRYM